jgi:hypothetical protein
MIVSAGPAADQKGATVAMSHSVQDGIDASSRARGRPSTDWHPVLAAIETEPGVWYMLAQYNTCYGIIRLLTIGGERGYRAVTWAERPEDRRLVGYFRTLRAACFQTHGVYLRAHGAPPRDGPGR